GVVNLRLDCTQDKLHTLSPGTRETLAKMDTDVTINFYFSRDLAELPVGIKNYARRVEDLLKEYEHYGKGRILVRKFNPTPDSDTEDAARVDNIEPMNAGMMPFYFGLAVKCLDEIQTIAQLSPGREEMLEYDLTRAIFRVLNPDKPRVGILSPLPIMGSAPENPMMAMQGRGQTPPWLVAQIMRQDYEVEELAADTDTISGEIDILLLVHPKDLPPATLFAIDQYLLRGGRVLAFLDAMSFAEQMQQPPQMMGMRPPTGASNLGPLLAAWGVNFVMLGDEPGVIADTQYMLQAPSQPGQPEQAFPTVLALGADAVNRADITVGQLDNLWLANSGAFVLEGETGLTRTRLLESSDKAGFVEKFQAMSLDPSTGRRILDALKTDGTRHLLGLRLEGSFATAFPEGAPGGTEGEKPAGDSLKKSSQDSVVVLFADTDLLSNDIAFVGVGAGPGRQPAFYEPRNENASLLMNTLEWLAGDNNLISLRSRGVRKRPLERFDSMLAEARKEYQGVMEGLESELRETEKRLRELEEKKAPGQNKQWHLSPEQQTELANLKQKSEAAERRQRDLCKEYRRDVDSLEKALMVLNIGAMPALVALGGLGLALIKRRRMVRK
ncbi:MAG: Gldg family protein, partial [Lentisphaeria bacterium]|nr:Gldg family protein [Lentisphaeria bacterium]